MTQFSEGPTPTLIRRGEGGGGGGGPNMPFLGKFFAPVERVGWETPGDQWQGIGPYKLHKG